MIKSILNSIRSCIGYKLLSLAFDIFPDKEKLILAKALEEVKQEMLSVTY